MKRARIVCDGNNAEIVVNYDSVSYQGNWAWFRRKSDLGGFFPVADVNLDRVSMIIWE